MSLLSSPSSSSSPRRLAGAACALLLGALTACTSEPEPQLEAQPEAVARAPRLPAIELPALAAGEAAALPTARTRPRPPGETDPLFRAVLGHWVGHCDVFVPGQDAPVFSVDTERISERTADPDEITWTIIYKTATTDIRRYFMRKDPAQPGRYLLDEKNGIVLTSYMHTDDLMINDFEGLGFRLRGREQYSRNRYDFEFVTSAVVPEITSDIGGTEFYAYQVVSTQRCSMRRAGRHGGDQD